MNEKRLSDQPLLPRSNPEHGDYVASSGSGPPRASSSRARRSVLAVLFLVFFFWNLQHCTRPFYSHHHRHHDSKRTNIILMISDGYGPASETFGRTFHQALHNDTSPTAHYKTPLDRLLVGSHRSRSSDSLITDSAAGATAFACGIKSYNGATVFEGAKEKGMLTGVVVTSRLTDATPACFIAHVPSRALESTIASQALGLSSDGANVDVQAPLDLAIGGGGCYFLPRSDPYSCRSDDVDLVSKAIEEGWNTRVLFGGASKEDHETSSVEHAGKQLRHFNESLHADEFLSQDLQLPLLALLAPFNTPYEIDRAASQPSLSSLALKALETLDNSPKNEKGFLIMIEGKCQI
jgi:alkaline phosphatase